MDERQRRRVQQLPRRETLESLGLDAGGRRDAATPAERVLAIANDRTTDVSEVHANLMRAAGAEPDTQQIGVRESRDEARVRHGVPATLRDRHLLPFPGMPRDRRLDVDGALAQMAPDERGVHALHRATLDRRGETPVRKIGLRDDQQPGRVAVQAVHDSRPALGRAARQFGAAADQDVDERVTPMAGAGMNDEAGWFVENRKMFVFEDKA